MEKVLIMALLCHSPLHHLQIGPDVVQLRYDEVQTVSFEGFHKIWYFSPFERTEKYCIWKTSWIVNITMGFISGFPLWWAEFYIRVTFQILLDPVCNFISFAFSLTWEYGKLQSTDNKNKTFHANRVISSCDLAKKKAIFIWMWKIMAKNIVTCTTSCAQCYKLLFYLEHNVRK